MPETRFLSGGCACGQVGYRVADAFRYAANCHCRRCRAFTGTAFKAFAGIEREHFELTHGAGALLIIGDEELNDTRCGACVFVGSKAPWFEITDSLPQYDGHVPA